MDRIDKVLSSLGYCSRKDCERMVRRGIITVNGLAIKSSSAKVSDSDVIEIEGERVEMPRTVVCIMNKPAGFVTSTSDDMSRTVMELLPGNMLRQNVVPAGRLDKDTEGLLVFSNDGDLIHRLISPKRKVPKTYYVEHEGVLDDKAREAALNGIQLKDGTICKGAVLEILGEGKSNITISEGMYHQVKRMFAALGCHVTYLKRTKIGKLELGDLQTGSVRELEEAEIEKLLSF